MTLAASLLFLADGPGLLKILTVKFSSWDSVDGMLSTVGKTLPSLIYLYALLLIPLSIGAQRIGYSPREFSKGFLVLFLLSVGVSILASNSWLKAAQLEAPLIALFLGLVISNTLTLPAWLHEALRTEYFVKTGIVLMGATLPFTIILQAGPVAIGQALLVSVVTFGSIYFAATRLFGLDRRFAACLGAGGSICGVSGAIAIGGACRAKAQHVSVAISLVIVWAVAMIFALPALCKWLGLDPGVAGAWIGTSEFADAAGFAAAEAIGDESAVQAFTLMKVVGRDMFVGIWAFLVAILSVTVWERIERSEARERQDLANAGAITANAPSATHTTKKAAHAITDDSEGGQPDHTDRTSISTTDTGAHERIDRSEIWRRFPKFVIGFFAASLLTTFFISVLNPADSAAYSKDALGALKSLRGWFFTLTFLAIGLTTRFRELTAVGIKPLLAFTVGVAINLPLGYVLSAHLFADFWSAL
ncbi:MAG: putative sulfate exporter family transporter [Lautropia sp.]|nr:putative sulfate exporter family transporter [Lautropia sp.]